MKLQALKCPECHSNLEIDEDLSFCFCQYCGCKIILDDERQETTTNKNININHNITYTDRQIDEEKQETTTNKHSNINKNISNIERLIDDANVIRAKGEADANRRNFWLKIAAIGGLLLLAISFFICCQITMITASNERITAGSSSYLIGKNYEFVEAHLEAAGFTDIELIDLNDSDVLSIADGIVESVSINGDTSFEITDRFSPSVKVVISHH